MSKTQFSIRKMEKCKKRSWKEKWAAETAHKIKCLEDDGLLARLADESTERGKGLSRFDKHTQVIPAALKSSLNEIYEYKDRFEVIRCQSRGFAASRTKR